VIVCPSRFAAEEAATLLDVASPVVIPNGVDDFFRSARPFDANDLARHGIRGRYVVHAGGATLRKNLGALADAWSRVLVEARDVSIVLCGADDARRTALFAGMERAVLLGHQDIPTIARLMSGAAAVVVPSLYEGFGLPALEGLAAGAPVVAADRGALREVCGDAAIFVEPTGTGICEGLLTVLRDSQITASLVERGRQRASIFSWDRCVGALAEVYRRFAP
jgi:glycosyltransferase involved in cell wall biosynthesis